MTERMPTMATNGLAVAVPPARDRYQENGRSYHSWHSGIYMFPCDEDEQDRMDIYHKLFEVARRGLLHQAPFEHNQRDPPRILDLGCGTGIWTIDMADKYPNAEVVGLDLVNIQPARIPPNLRFRVPTDFEGHWTLGYNSWDLIHVRMALGSVPSWPELYQKIHLHLKPGHGYLEQVEIDLQPRCDDASLPANAYLYQWYNHLMAATAENGRSIAYQHNTRQMLEQAGFIDIQETIIRAPLNQWPSDPHQKDIGKWYQVGLTQGLEGLSLAPFSRVFRWNYTNEIRPYCQLVHNEICQRNIHAYNNMWVPNRRMVQTHLDRPTTHPVETLKLEDLSPSFWEGAVKHDCKADAKTHHQQWFLRYMYETQGLQIGPRRTCRREKL